MTHLALFEVCCIGAALFVTSNLWFYLRLLRPIRQLACQADRLSQGELDSFEQQTGGISEIRRLRWAMAGMVGHIGWAQEQSRSYGVQLASGQENERKRIARELHDDTVQSMIGVSQGIELAQHWLGTDVAQAQEMLTTVREQTVEAATRLRNLIGGLRPPALEELGFIPALKLQLETIQQANISLAIKGDIRRLDEAYELALFRTVQEALNNIARHSEGDQVTIDVDYQSQYVTLQVQDNRCGFELPSDLASQNHFGLLGIQERVSSLGGTLAIQSRIEQGTRLHIKLPLGVQQQPDDRVRDPVCRALIESQQAYGNVTLQGSVYYFCCPVCQGAFQKDPALYLDFE